MTKSDPCPLCGETDFTLGKIVDTGFRFTSSDSIFGFGNKVNARRCNSCGNLQFFTQIPAPKDKVKRKHGE